MLKSTRTKHTFEVRRDLTQGAAEALVKMRDRKKSNLINKNESSTGFFDASRMKDHAAERAKKDYAIRENNANKIKHPPETRHEVLDYYEMNRKVIDRSYELKPGELNQHFKNMKKLTPLLIKKKKEDVDVSKDALSISAILPSKRMTKEEILNSVDRLAQPRKKN
jgi:hypothetical protein